MPAITTNDLKNGITLELDNGLFQVVEFQHVKPGKGGAFVRTKLRNVRTGAVLDRTFNAGIQVEQAIVDSAGHAVPLPRRRRLRVHGQRRRYDQMHVPPAALGDAADYLVEQMIAQIAIYQGEIVGVEIAGVGRADDHRDRAGRAGRPRVGRPQAGHARDRQGRPGAAVRRTSATGSRSTPAPATTSPASDRADPTPHAAPRRTLRRPRAGPVPAVRGRVEGHRAGRRARPARSLEPDALTADWWPASASTASGSTRRSPARPRAGRSSACRCIDLNVLRHRVVRAGRAPRRAGRRRPRRGGRAGQAVLHRRQRPLRQRRAVGPGRRPANIEGDVRVDRRERSPAVALPTSVSTIDRGDTVDGAVGAPPTRGGVPRSRC